MSDVVLTRDQCRELDRRAMETYGISGLVLMENAGRGVVDVLERLGVERDTERGVVVLCGKGNNAGDGFVIARHLDIRGHTCRVVLLGDATELTGDAATNFAILRKTDVPIVEFDPSLDVSDANWLLDAMLGTGAQGEPRPPLDAAIDWFNSQSCKTLAVDVPSGLDCDTGRPASHTICADHTCTFAAMKTGFTQPAAKKFTGTIHVCDIGTPPKLIAEVVN
jgi:NAD(P)H-hydrate epimerase